MTATGAAAGQHTIWPPGSDYPLDPRASVDNSATASRVAWMPHSTVATVMS